MSNVFYENLNKEWFNWYLTRYARLNNLRFPSFHSALTILLQISGDSRIIVETGTQRQDDDLGAGESTSIFGAFCSMNGGHLYTVDNRQEHLEISRSVTAEFANNIDYILSDSVTFLETFEKKIDLLYLDSLDYDETDPNRCKEHCLKEAKAAMRLMKDKSVLVIDDCNWSGLADKPAFAYEYLIEQGWLVTYIHQQIVFLRCK